MEKKQLVDAEVVENKTCGGVLDIPDLSKGENIIDIINKANTEKNEDFAKMDKLQKRVVLAKDVIAQIEAKRYTACNGSYLTIRDTRYEKYSEEGELKLNKSLIGKENVVCEVCAIGSLFLANAEKINRRLTDSDDGMVKSLSGIFTPKELRKLEFLFEGDDIASSFVTDTEDNKILRKDVKSFRSGLRTSEKRLVAIMQNIIDNNGNFKHASILI